MVESETATQLQSILDSGGDAESQVICGKFHAHLTLEISSQQLPACREFCRAHRVKLTVVDLENAQGQQQTDVMVTCHFRDDQPDAIRRITQQLASLTFQLERAGWQVVRAKLEHESLPSYATYTSHRYHEVHVKLSMPADSYADDYERLKVLGAELGFVPSRNPLHRSEQMVSQFINLRLYRGDRQTADTQVNHIVDALHAAGFSVTEVKRETVVYDTAQHTDAWWA